MNAHNSEDHVLGELRKKSLKGKEARLTSDVATGRLLTFLCRVIKAKKVLDLGTFTGCSAYAMALALPEDGKVIACDTNVEHSDMGRMYWEQGKIAGKVEMRVKPVAESLKELLDSGEGETFDLIFIDADKKNYPMYFELGMKLIRVGGIFVVDDALWHGNPANTGVKDPDTLGVRKMNELMKDDKRLEFVLLDLCNGTGIAQKKSNSAEGGGAAAAEVGGGEETTDS